MHTNRAKIAASPAFGPWKPLSSDPMNTPHTLLACLTFTAATLSAAMLPESQKIDQLLAQGWEKAGLKPNPPASDEVLVRRLYLDIAGRIPTVEEVQAYLKSGDPQKRSKLIDTLLASDGYTSHMFNYWADILRLSDNVKGRLTAEAYEEWLKKQIKANVPYDQMVRNLLTTDGGVWDSGSIGFWQRDENKLDHLAYTVQVFLGTSIVCAQCHDHPFDKWSQMDYYHMAAFTYGMDTRSRGFEPEDAEAEAAARQETARQHGSEGTPRLHEEDAGGAEERRPDRGRLREPRGHAEGEAGHAGRDETAALHQRRVAGGQTAHAATRLQVCGWKARRKSHGQGHVWQRDRPPRTDETTLQAFADWMADSRRTRASPR
jgi:hypothetical protein